MNGNDIHARFADVIFQVLDLVNMEEHMGIHSRYMDTSNSASS
jgi:hypothetical protein